MNSDLPLPSIFAAMSKWAAGDADTKLDETYIVQNLTYQNQMGKGEKLPFLLDGTPYRQTSLFDEGQMLEGLNVV